MTRPLFDGERMVPGETGYEREYLEHLQRYTFAARVAAGAKVLEIGCGSGYGSRLLADVAATVTAVDVSPEAIAYCQAQVPTANVEYRCCDALAQDAGLPGADLVIAFEVIEHVEEYDRLMRVLAGCLLPGGMAIVSTPNVLITQYGSPFHVKEFTLEEFRTLCQRHFESVDLMGQAYTPEFARVHTLWNACARLQRRVEDLERLADRPVYALLRSLCPGALRRCLRAAKQPPPSVKAPASQAQVHTSHLGEQRIPSVYTTMRPADLVMQQDELQSCKTFVAVLQQPR